MFWNEQTSEHEFVVPDSVQDVHFDIQCRSLPVDHLYELSNAIIDQAPWLADAENAGIHEIHVAGSQNGWELPDPSLGQMLILSKRTKLVIRTGKDSLGLLVQSLCGSEFTVADQPIRIGQGKARSLSASDTLYARHIAMTQSEAEDEPAFLQRRIEELATLHIRPKKILCGKSSTISSKDRMLLTRSLMLADLAPEESYLLQAHGLGSNRLLGCGLFLPMKGIKRVLGSD